MNCELQFSIYQNLLHNVKLLNSEFQTLMIECVVSRKESLFHFFLQNMTITSKFEIPKSNQNTINEQSNVIKHYKTINFHTLLINIGKDCIIVCCI